VPWRARPHAQPARSHYFDINLDVHWATITDDLPMLLAALSPPGDLILRRSSVQDSAMHNARR
jgi:uncharacterized protein with HEPN domain